MAVERLSDERLAELRKAIHIYNPKVIDELIDDIVRVRTFTGCDGCSTSDCPHDDVHDCVQAQAKIIAEQASEIERLKIEQSALIAELTIGKVAVQEAKKRLAEREVNNG